ncbi:MAG: Tat pathway signal protein [Thermomicrobiales bacterium]
MAETRAGDPRIWACFFHLGYNTYADRDCPDVWERSGNRHLSSRNYLRFDRGLWNDLVDQMVDGGVTMVVLGLGEGVRYQSHPELAVNGSWSVDKLRTEVARLRELGIEPIPKLNFSAAHDDWLGPYARMVSTETYYQVCRDLIAEVLEIFDRPRFFHLGYDEEILVHQRWYDYVVIRQHDLWWRDFYFFVDLVEQGGAQAWIWSDYLWNHPEAFVQRMPRSVMQSNWYYDADFSLATKDDSAKEADRLTRLRAFVTMEEHGFHQIPAGSVDVDVANFDGLVPFCREQIAPERLHGFLQTVWRPVLEEFRDRHVEGVTRIVQARKAAEAEGRGRNA